MKKRVLCTLISLAMALAMIGGLCSIASAATVTDMSEFIVESATPTSFGRWDGYTGTVTDGGVNNTRTIAYSGSSTGSHISLSIPGYAVNTNADAKPYIMHLSYRIQNDRTTPVYLTHTIRYKNSSNQNSSYNDIFSSNTTQFTMNQDTSLNITSANQANFNNLDFYDYKYDLYENLKTGAYEIYINGVKWISAYDYSTAKNLFGSDSKKIHEYRIRVTGMEGTSWAFKLVNPCYEIYSEDVMMDEVIAYSVSGMSNYLNATASEQVRPGINGGNATYTGIAGTESDLGGYTSYNISGASGKNLRWWSGSQNTNGSHCAFVGSFATADKAWMHIGFNITGTASANFHFQYWKSGGDTATTGETAGFSGTDYREDLYIDLSGKKIYMYKDNIYQDVAGIGFTSDAKQIKNIYFNKKDANSFTMSDLVIEYFAAGCTPSDMLIGYDSRSLTTQDYVYQINGIKTGTNVIGKIDGLCSITGDNTTGYKIQPNSVNANNGGFARFYLAYTSDTGIYKRDTDRVLHQTFYYRPAAVTTEQTIGIRGNNGYAYLLYANPATGNFETQTREKIKSYDTDTFYKIDYILNNYDYKYYFLLDGQCIASGTLSSSRQPIWQIVYTSRSTNDYMIIKDLTTTLYKDNYTITDIVAPNLSQLYSHIESVSVSGNNANVSASFIGPETNSGANTKAIFAAYDSNGALINCVITDNAANLINNSTANASIVLPDSVETGDTVTFKVFMWNINLQDDTIIPLSNASKKTYTLQ